MTGLEAIEKHYASIAGRVIGLQKLGETVAEECWAGLAHDMLCALETERQFREFAINHPSRAFTFFEDTCQDENSPCFCKTCRSYGG